MLAGNRTALAIAAAGLLLTFTAPGHRLDLLLIGLAGVLGGLLWRPRVGPVVLDSQQAGRPDAVPSTP